MTGIINTGSVPKALQVGVKEWWGMEYNRHPLEFPAIFDTMDTEKAYEEAVMLVGTGMFPRKAEGAPINYDSVRQGFLARFNQLTYAMGVIFTYEMLKFKQYDLGFKKAGFIGRSARVTQETLNWNIVNRAFNSSYTMGSGHDGKSLCDTGHPNISGGTYSNMLATPADFSHAALEQLNIQIDNALDDRGLPMAIRATKLVGPTALRFEFARVLKSVQESGTPNNDINAVRTELNLETVISHYMDDPDMWGLLTDCPNGLRRFVAEAAAAPVQENDFDTRNLKYASFFMEASGWEDPRAWYSSQGI
jgi:hypothetical protein